MAWDFSTEPEFEDKLQWMRQFCKEEIEPLEVLGLEYDTLVKVVKPLQEIVKQKGLFAAHLSEDLGGQGFGQLKLGLMHEILGRCHISPLVFGNNAPDSGNAELIAIGINETGREDQREKWLNPLLSGQKHSGFSMTEPEVAGSDPKLIRTRAIKDGDEWVINGHKWFTTNGSIADFLVVMAVTNPDVHPYQGCSMILVPADTPGVKVIRDVPTMGEPHVEFGNFGGHSEITYIDVRVPVENLIGFEGHGFRLAQERLGPGRIHHAMRWIGQANRAFDILCEQSLSRFMHESYLAEKQTVQNWIAESYAELTAAKLMTLQAAWKMDTYGNKASRIDISAIKFYGAKVLFNVIDRAIQACGALGFSSDLPLEAMYRYARAARIYDGADEVHKVTVARQVLKNYEKKEVLTEYGPLRRQAAEKKFKDILLELT